MDALENGLVNLAAIVGLLVFSMSVIPLILIKGTQKAPPANADDASTD